MQHYAQDDGNVCSHYCNNLKCVWHPISEDFKSHTCSVM